MNGAISITCFETWQFDTYIQLSCRCEWSFNLIMSKVTILSNFEIRHDVTLGRLRASLRITLKRACFAVIPYTAHTFYGNSPQICNDIASNLKVGQNVHLVTQEKWWAKQILVDKICLCSNLLHIVLKFHTQLGKSCFYHVWKYNIAVYYHS